MAHQYWHGMLVGAALGLGLGSIGAAVPAQQIRAAAPSSRLEARSMSGRLRIECGTRCTHIHIGPHHGFSERLQHAARDTLINACSAPGHALRHWCIRPPLPVAGTVGQTRYSGTWAVSLMSGTGTRILGSGSSQDTTPGLFVALTVAVRNEGAVPAMLAPGDFALWDQGTVYAVDTPADLALAGQYPPPLVYTLSVPAGALREVQIVFNVVSLTDILSRPSSTRPLTTAVLDAAGATFLFDVVPPCTFTQVMQGQCQTS